MSVDENLTKAGGILPSKGPNDVHGYDTRTASPQTEDRATSGESQAAEALDMRKEQIDGPNKPHNEPIRPNEVGGSGKQGEEEFEEPRKGGAKGEEFEEPRKSRVRSELTEGGDDLSNVNE